MSTKLIIVESPAKARTISRYLGEGFVVESSIGHIRDLPSTAAEIPARYKGQSWSRIGVDVEQGFKPLYVIPASKKAQVNKLKAKLKEASELYLATDEDREGEAIAWHLVEVLQPQIPVRRMVFHEITEAAIQHALEHTREIDQRLVSAQETRRILDRLVGYEVSPLLWRKLRPKLSAGRVQSVATRLVVAREEARLRFVEAVYWAIEARLAPSGHEASPFAARLAELDGRRIATGKDFDNASGELKNGNALCLDDPTARDLARELEAAEFTVAQVVETPFTAKPYPPFMTSTLQQEAARKLRFNPQRTMRVAQALYENGYITYMRTDSTTLSGEAIHAARQQVEELYGSEYLPDRPRQYRRKSKSAQEAHEAIRPAGGSFRTPKSLAGVLTGDQLRLYELIWQRTMASQMKDAKGRRTTLRIEAPTETHATAVFTASGKVFEFSGFLRTYVEGTDDPEAELADQEKLLPPTQTGDRLIQREIAASERRTQPPSRYTEAMLVKELEARGIGRPSTYATIIQTIQDRGYVWHKGAALVPTFTAIAVVRLLESFLPDLVDYDFTAKMEDELDTIARGDRSPGPWMRDFYFGSPEGTDGGRKINRMGLRRLIDTTGEAIAPWEASRIPIGSTDDGCEVAVRVGRYGSFVQLGDTNHRAAVPDDLPPDELTPAKALELIAKAAADDRILGEDPATGKPVYLKTGRYGPYVQLGDPELTEKGKVKRGGKARMASLWPQMSPETLTLEQALLLLSFPREVGVHPDNEQVITAQNGRFGPFIKMGDDSRSLPDHDSLTTVTLEEALELFRQPKGRGRRSAPALIADLGAQPDSGASIQVKTGRYGPYVTDGTVNATVPKGTEPDAVTLERAVELLAAREEKLRAQGKDPRAKKKSGGRRTKKA